MRRGQRATVERERAAATREVHGDVIAECGPTAGHISSSSSASSLHTHVPSALDALRVARSPTARPPPTL